MTEAEFRKEMEEMGTIGPNRYDTAVRLVSLQELTVSSVADPAVSDFYWAETLRDEELYVAHVLLLKQFSKVDDKDKVVPDTVGVWAYERIFTGRLVDILRAASGTVSNL